MLFEMVNGNIRTLWMLRLRDRVVERFGPFESREAIDAVFSPDGRWVAYDSTEGGAAARPGGEGGESNVYVEPFPPNGDRYQITKDVGRSPFWWSGGGELACSTGPASWETVTVRTRPSLMIEKPVAFARGITTTRGPELPRQFDGHPDWPPGDRCRLREHPLVIRSFRGGDRRRAQLERGIETPGP